MSNLATSESYLKFHDFIINCENDFSTSRVVASRGELTLIIDVEDDSSYGSNHKSNGAKSNEGQYLRIKNWRDLSLYLSALQ